MPTRLLPIETALRKIELSLILQGKSFKTKFLNCDNCKFGWKSIAGGRISIPEKHGWFCFKYANKPHHSFIHFKAVRINAAGQEIPIGTVWSIDQRRYVATTPKEGEKDIIKIMRPMRRKKYAKVCRRFEACPR